MWLSLRDYQLDAINRMKTGCILCGGVGSGKSRTALAYYYLRNGGELDSESYIPMDNGSKHRPKDLYIITTARKRDTCEWEAELAPFLLSTHKETNCYSNRVVVDSWNNIAKYSGLTGAFFIFDEQRVVGNGTWVKSFLKIAKDNEWILLSATPGDTWSDYIPVFIANGFYKNRTAFIQEHVVYRWVNKTYPKIERYTNTGKLIRHRNDILVDMDFNRQTVRHHENVFVEYDKALYKRIMKDRWDIWKDKPIQNASELFYDLRKLVNSDESRQVKLLEILEDHPKAI